MATVASQVTTTVNGVRGAYDGVSSTNQEVRGNLGECYDYENGLLTVVTK